MRNSIVGVVLASAFEVPAISAVQKGYRSGALEGDRLHNEFSDGARRGASPDFSWAAGFQQNWRCSTRRAARLCRRRAIGEHSDDLFFDASKGRIYILGEGFIEAWQQKDPYHSELATPFETIPHHGQQGAEILVCKTN
jgi:hypothetical protein